MNIKLDENLPLRLATRLKDVMTCKPSMTSGSSVTRHRNLASGSAGIEIPDYSRLGLFRFAKVCSWFAPRNPAAASSLAKSQKLGRSSCRDFSKRKPWRVGRLFCCRDGTQDSRAGFLERNADETKENTKESGPQWVNVRQLPRRGSYSRGGRSRRHQTRTRAATPTGAPSGDRESQTSSHLPLIALTPSLVCAKENSVPMVLQAAYGTHFTRGTVEFSRLIVLGCGRKRIGGVKNEVCRIIRHLSNPDASHSMCFKSPLTEVGCARTCCLYSCDHMSHLAVSRIAKGCSRL
jgi:hypothetical protein